MVVVRDGDASHKSVQRPLKNKVLFSPNTADSLIPILLSTILANISVISSEKLKCAL